MKFVSNELLKYAIVEEAIRNPDNIRAQFVIDEGEEFDVTAAQRVANWDYEPEGGERTREGYNMTCFNCYPYDDQLRAYTVDDGEKILSVKIVGE